MAEKEPTIVKEESRLGEKEPTTTVLPEEREKVSQPSPLEKREQVCGVLPEHVEKKELEREPLEKKELPREPVEKREVEQRGPVGEESKSMFHVPSGQTYEYPPGAVKHIPGEPLATSTSLLESGAGFLQGQTPLSNIRTYFCGIEFYNGNPKRQIIGHHYCGHINEDLQQCLIFDGPKSDARLIGIEYIVSDRLFKNFPDEEKALWHSHAHEVLSGIQSTRHVPTMLENRLMERMVHTYGKTFHFWHIDKDPLPFGIPQLMMTFTDDGQVDQRVLRWRDEELGINTEEVRKSREYIKRPAKLEGCDLFTTGKTVQLNLGNVQQT